MAFSRFPCKGGLAGLLLLCTAHTVHGDAVLLQGGEQISGTIDSIDSTHVIISTEWAGQLSINREAVHRVTADEPLYVRLLDGSLIRQAQFVNAETDAGSAPALNLAEVDRAERQAITEVPASSADLWTGNFSYGVNFSRGNSETSTHALNADASSKRQDWRHSLSLKLDLAKDEEETTREQYGLDYQLDWFIRPEWFVYASGSYFRDPLRDLVRRITISTGAGRQFWDNSKGRFGGRSWRVNCAGKAGRQR